MARPRNLNDEQILAEARKCFLEYGAGVSTTVIAERLGISHGVLFQRFGTKEHLLRSALLPQVELPWFAVARKGPDERGVREQLRELAGAILADFERIVPGLMMLRSAGIDPDWTNTCPEHVPPVLARRELAGWFGRAQSRGLLGPVKPEHAADLLLGALQIRPFHQHLLRQTADPADVEPYLDFTVELICRSLAPARE